MQTLLLFSVLSQVVTPLALAPPVEPTAVTWSDGQRTYTLWESPLLIAEPGPTEARRASLLEVEPGAVLVVDRPTMRVWKVRDARRVRSMLPALVPVFHEVRSGVGRMRVPLGLVCDGARQTAPWQDVFARSGATCLPDFWYPPVLK